MTTLQAVFYGILQGLAEFLPISSSGHLALAHTFFGASDAEHLAFDVLLHFATLLSIAVSFRKDVSALFGGGLSVAARVFRRTKEPLSDRERLFLYLCAASVPLLPASLFADRIEALGRSAVLVGALLICNGILLLVSDALPAGTRRPERLGYLRALFIGCTQTFGILPGISRSGSTITGGRIGGLNGESAVRFSFLLSIPAVLGASVLELPSFFAHGIEPAMRLPCLVGFLTAFFTGLGAIRLLRFCSERRGFTFFGLYTIAIGLIAVLIG